MSKKIPSSSPKSGRLFLLLLLVCAFGVSYIYIHFRDERIAKQVYQELVILDGQLDKLKQTASQLAAENSIDSQLIRGIDGLSIASFIQQRPALLKLLAQANCESQLQAKVESQLAATDSRNPRLFNQKFKELKMSARELKYYQKVAVSNFQQQISQLTQQLAAINAKIKQIHAGRLQELELARLKFISKKLTETAHQLNPAASQEFFKDIATTITAVEESSNN